jgi:hypothetical protein
MRDKIHPVSWLISCDRPVELQRAEQIARSESALGNVITDVARAFPNGKEATVVRHHRIGDYFGAVDVCSSRNGDTKSFMLVFHPLPAADRYWRDMMAEVLRSIRSACEGISITAMKNTTGAS